MAKLAEADETGATAAARLHMNGRWKEGNSSTGREGEDTAQSLHREKEAEQSTVRAQRPKRQR